MASIDSIMAGWVSASAFNDSAVFAFGNKAQVDRCITRLAASAIKLALDEVAAGRTGTSTEANTLIYQALVYMKRDAALLRQYLMNFGPFAPAKTDITVEVQGRRVAIEKKLAVRFSEKIQKEKFSQFSAEQYAKEADSVNFATWKSAVKAAQTVQLSEEAQQAENKKKLQARLDRVLKAAKEEGIELDYPWPKTETVKIRPSLSFDSVLEAIKEASQSDKLKDEHRIILDDMLGLAIKMLASVKG